MYKCTATVVRPIDRRTDDFSLCGAPAKWQHLSGCTGKGYRCTRHTYKLYKGRGCTHCGNPVQPIEAETGS